MNVNYRYVAEELSYLLNDAKARGVVVHDRFAPTLGAVLDDLGGVDLVIQVPDDSGEALLPGAVRWDDLLAEGDDEPIGDDVSPDDLYILYTGGTTGMPKGVLWRQHDIFVSAMGGRPFGAPEAYGSIEEIVAASANGGLNMMTAAPLMHGAAQWAAFNSFTSGGMLVLAPDPSRFDAETLVRVAAEERATAIQVVGDAMARPLIEVIERGDYDLSGLLAFTNGGAALSTGLKDRFLEAVPHAMVLDAVGSSETGAQMGHTSVKGATATGTFTPGPDTAVISADMTRVLEPGDPEEGWLAQRGHVPLGYLGDEAKTARTFPVIGGVRYSVPGDRARRPSADVIELLGRDAQTINTGGEKVFAEEVEQAIVNHPDVDDVMVVGRPDDRWGQAVVALVQLHPGTSPSVEEILEETAKHVARYKLPRQIVFLDELVRSPAGKADYRWAKATAVEHASTEN
ncbi:MAG: AMP-binding protein, partial [Acidimicrobiales bacterium]|nr:AMP-binding protein [Acidimicrobiales bacterium]